MSELGETIRLRRFDKERGNTVVVTGKSEIPETTEHLSKVDADILHGGKKRPIKLISKRPMVFFSLPDVGTDHTEKYYGIWKRLKEAKLPVVPTVRKVSKDEVLMTDLTADGSAFYDKDADYKMRMRSYVANPLDREFLGVNLITVIQQAKRITNKANSQGIALAGDDPLSLLVHPDGTWDIFVLDIGATIFDINKKDAKRINGNNLETFKRQLRSIKDYLLIK